MNNFYAKLDILPKERLIRYDMLNPDLESINLFELHPEDVLTEEAIDFFNQFGLKVLFVANFVTPLALLPGTPETRVMHTDNRTVDGVRVPILCGINFEISKPTNTTWTWFNMDAVPRTYREHTDTSDFERKIKMRAEVFNECGIPEGSIPIQSLDYTDDDIYLVRTDLPHMVTYDSYDKPRSGISIRFVETWSTWEECWKVFEPMMKK